MSNHRKARRRSLVALVITMSFGFALVTSGGSSLAQQGSTGPLGDGGVLGLHMGADDYIGFRAPDPLNPGQYLPLAPADSQTISTSSGCKLSLTPPSTLVTFSATASSPNPSVGFVGDAIGVGAKGEGNGQPCGRIDAPGQTLTMDLRLAGKVIDYAEIDVEVKFSATVVITGYLVQGTTATQVGTPEQYASTGSDSGPDSGDGDNYRIRFPKTGTTTVNRLVFSIATTGGASLEGGADGTAACDAADGCTEPSLGQALGTTDSLFHLTNVDGFLDCPSGSGPSQATEGDPGEPSSTLDRRENVGGADCTPIPYNLESGPGATPGCVPLSPQCILLQKDLLGQATQFFWSVTWAPEDGTYMETETEFDFDFNGTFAPIQLCLADENDDGFPDLPGSDPWCVVDTSTKLQIDTGLVIVTETYFGSGDPGGKR